MGLENFMCSALKSDLLTCRTLRLLMIKTTRGRTFSATTALKHGAVLTSTWGRCPSASDCRRETTCWCPPPSSRTTRLISWSGSSPRTKLEPCMSMQILFSVISQILKQISAKHESSVIIYSHLLMSFKTHMLLFFLWLQKEKVWKNLHAALFMLMQLQKNTKMHHLNTMKVVYMTHSIILHYKSHNFVWWTGLKALFTNKYS